ncbi:MAG: cell division protein FtsL [Steroidobacteraceae bacterium]|nr:cell division protein FtsL [Steroidobacteraceae bacterium]
MIALSRRTLAIAVPLLWMLALASAAGAIWAKHRSRELFIELERLNVARDNLEVEWGQLQLEQSAWSTHAFVENVARARLHMATPVPQDIEIVRP